MKTVFIWGPFSSLVLWLLNGLDDRWWRSVMLLHIGSLVVVFFFLCCCCCCYVFRSDRIRVFVSTRKKHRISLQHIYAYTHCVYLCLIHWIRRCSEKEKECLDKNLSFVLLWSLFVLRFSWTTTHVAFGNVLAFFLLLLFIHKMDDDVLMQYTQTVL